jgi:CRP/FNR family transcriptional regulator, anaerobic regulatory protein
MTVKQYKPDEIIIAEGTYGTQTYLIREGRVMICKETGAKGRIPIAILTAGEVFGEMYLFDDTGFRTASVVAQSDVTVEIIPKDEMEKLLASTPQIVVSMIKTLSARLAQTSQENSILKYRQHGLIRRWFHKIFG